MNPTTNVRFREKTGPFFGKIWLENKFCDEAMETCGGNI
jgi:hypothetical protein